MSAEAPRRRGRPSRSQAASGPATRDRILAAARGEFSEWGYDKASVRGIAKAAGVDPALVHHYFGRKEDIFGAAVEQSFAPALEVSEAIAGAGPHGVGENMARYLFGVWENPVTRLPLLAVLRSAMTNENAAAVLRRLIERRLLARVAGVLDVPDSEFRVQLAAGHLIGIAMLRYVVKMEPTASADIEDVIAMVAPTLERYMTQA